MIPNTWISIVFFLFFVAPGFLFQLLGERRRVGVQESTFREISRVVLGSTAFSTIAISLILVVSWLVSLRYQSALLNLDRLVRDPSGYLADEHTILFVLLVMELVLALGLAWMTDLALCRRHSSGNISVESAWTRVFRLDCDEGLVPHARVQLIDGSVYAGVALAATPDHAVEDRELVLAPPIAYKPKDGKKLEVVSTTFQRVVLHHREIKAILVEYHPLPASSPERNQTVATRVDNGM